MRHSFSSTETYSQRPSCCEHFFIIIIVIVIIAANERSEWAATLIWTRQRLGYLCQPDNIPVEARLLRDNVQWMIQDGVPSRAQSSLLCRPENIPFEARLLRDPVRWMIQDGVPYSCPVFSPVLAKFETIYHVDAIRSIFLSKEITIILTYFWCVHGYVFIFFLCLMCYLLRAHFPIFLFARAYIIVLYSADVGRILYCCERDGLPVVNPYHFAFRFWAWLAGWLWMTTSFPVPSSRQGNVHDWLHAFCVKTVEVLKYWIHTATDWYTESSKWYTESSEEKARVLVRFSWSWNCHCKSRTDKHKSS